MLNLMHSYIGDYGESFDGKDVEYLDRIANAINNLKYETIDYAKAQKIVTRNYNRLSPEAQAHVDDVNLTIDSYRKLGNQFVFTGEGLRGLGTMVKAVGKEFLKFGLQFAGMLLITEGLNLAIKLLGYIKDNLPTFENLARKAEEATIALEDLQSEINTLNSELETTKERIEELQTKGSLTLTEQEELKNLQLQNALLTEQLAIKRELERDQREKASESNLAAADKLYEGMQDDLDAYRMAKSNFDDIPNRADLDSAEEIDKSQQTWNKIMSERKSVLIEIASQMQSFLANIDASTLNADDLAEYNSYMKELNSILYEIGTISIDEMLQASLSADAYSRFKEQMSDMAEAGYTTAAEVEAAFSKSFPEVLALLDELGLGAEGLAEEINSLRNTGEVVNQIINDGASFAGIRDKIDEIVADEAFELDASSITAELGQDFIDALDTAGVSVEQLIAYIESLQDAIDEVSIKDVTEELSGFESDIDALSDAYYEFVDNAGKVNASVLSELTETFADVSGTEEFENLINTLGNAGSTAEEVKRSMDKLLDVYFSAEAAAGNLTEANKELYISQLKQMGISNASEVVEYKLALARIEAAEAGTAEEKAAREAAAALVEENTRLDQTAAAALSAAQEILLYNTYKDYVASGNFAAVIDTHKEALYEAATAAGTAATNLARYAQILLELDKYEQSIKIDPSDQYAVTRLENELKSITTAAETEYNNLFKADVDFSPVRTKDSSGESAADKAYKKAKEKLDHQLETNRISYNEYYQALVDLGNKYYKNDADKMTEHYATLADVRRDAYAKYQGDLDKDLEKGLITLQQYYDQSMALSKKWLDGRKVNEEDYKEAVETIYDAVNDAWGDRISKMETQMDRWTLDKAWEPGKKEADYWRKMLDDLEGDYLAGLFDSTDEYYDHRYDLLQKLHDAEKEAWEDQLDMIQEQSDSIEELVDLVSEMMKKELEDQIEALEEIRDKYADIVDEKKKSLDLTREENEYQQQLAEYNESLAELQAKAAVLALDDSREGKASYAAVMEEIRDLQKDIGQTQSDHTYDATTEALDAAQTAYEEKIDRKISDIEALMEEAGPWLERVYERIEQTPPSTLLAELTKYNYYHGTGMDKDVQKIWQGSEALLQSFNSNIPLILDYLASQENDLQAKIEAGETGSGSNLSSNYETSLSKKVQASATQKNSDATNMDLLTQVRNQYGSGWYDEEKNVIYMGSDDDRRVTAGAYELIQQMEEINKSNIAYAEKKKQLDALLAKLVKKWSYGDAHLTYDKDAERFHLHKYAGTSAKWQIFHEGVQQGFVGGKTGTSNKQRELLALLQSGEIVLNRQDQGVLLANLQTLQTMADGLKKLQLDSIPGDTYGVGEMNITVNAPITIQGSVDDDTIDKLEKFKKNLSRDVLGEVTESMKKRGYGINVATNARKK